MLSLLYALECFTDYVNKDFVTVVDNVNIVIIIIGTVWSTDQCELWNWWNYVIGGIAVLICATINGKNRQLFCYMGTVNNEITINRSYFQWALLDITQFVYITSVLSAPSHGLGQLLRTIRLFLSVIE